MVFFPGFSPETLVFFDIPLFLLLFGASFIIIRFVVKVHEPIMNTAIAAFAGGLAFIAVRSQASISRWLLFNSDKFFAVVLIILIVFIFLKLFSKI